MTPVYNSQVEYEPKENESYDIVSVNEITTRTGLQGVRMEFKSKNTLDKRVYVKTLWPQENAKSTSPWGAFISTLGNDTDGWFGKRIRVLSNQTRIFEITLEKVENKKKKDGE